MAGSVTRCSREIDKQGNLVAAYHGVVDGDAVEATIKSLLAKHSQFHVRRVP